SLDGRQQRLWRKRKHDFAVDSGSKRSLAFILRRRLSHVCRRQRIGSLRVLAKTKCFDQFLPPLVRITGDRTHYHQGCARLPAMVLELVPQREKKELPAAIEPVVVPVPVRRAWNA